MKWPWTKESKFDILDRRGAELRPIHYRDSQTQGYSPHGIVASDVELAISRATPQMVAVAKAIVAASRAGKPVIFFLGGHVIKEGLSKCIISLLSNLQYGAVAGAGAMLVHDYEMSTWRGTSEYVEKTLPDGSFGMWEENTAINEIAKIAAKRKWGFGETTGWWLAAQGKCRASESLALWCWQNSVPYTVHTTIGGDVFYQYPNCDGAAIGAASYRDFLIFARLVKNLNRGGVFLNIGSSVHGPEVFLKALSLARNVGRAKGERVRNFTTAVFDREMPNDGKDYTGADFTNDDQLYYWRPWKTVLRRSILEADGSTCGESYFVQGEHALTVRVLQLLVNELSKGKKIDRNDDNSTTAAAAGAANS